MPRSKDQYAQSKLRALLLGCGKSRDKRMKFEPSKRVGRGSPDNDFTKYDIVTHDINERTGAMVLHDLEEFPYPWDDDEFDEVHAYEVLEHTGTQGDAEFFFDQMNELWRILRVGGYLMITVPAWDSLEMWGVPDHKRALPPQIFQFCNRKYIEKTVKRPMGGDYRDLLGPMNFEVIGVEEDQSHAGIVLRKAK